MSCSSLSPRLALLIDHLLPRRIFDALTLGSVEDRTCGRGVGALCRAAYKPVAFAHQRARPAVDRARTAFARAQRITAGRLRVALAPAVGEIADILVVRLHRFG